MILLKIYVLQKCIMDIAALYNVYRIVSVGEISNCKVNLFASKMKWRVRRKLAAWKSRGN